MNDTVFLLGSVDAYQAGQMVGGFLMLVLLFFGAVKSFLAVGREGTNALCALSLGLFLLGFFLSAAMNAVGIGLPEYQRVLSVLSGLLVVLTSLVALILAIVGLATFDPRRHVRGRGYAIWSLVLGCLFMLLAVIGAVVGVAAARDGRLSVTEGGGSTVVSEEFNCSIGCPPGWVSTRPDRLNSDACIAFRRSRPEGYSIVIGEQVNFPLAPDEVIEILKEQSAGVAESIEKDRTEPVLLNGMQFMRRTFVMKQRGLPQEFYFEQWVTTRPGFVWQIQLWCLEKDQQRLTPEFRAIVASLRVTDPHRVTSLGGALANVERPSWGYRTRLDEGAWNSMTVPSMPLVDFSAERPLEAIFVMPVELPLEMEDLGVLASGLLGRMGISYPSAEWTPKSWNSAWGNGLEITGKRDVDGTPYQYVLRICRKGRLAQLHAGWFAVKDGDERLIREALDRIDLAEVMGSPPALSPKQQQELSLICNEIGIALYNRKALREAIAWFGQASDLNASDVAILENVVSTMQEMGQSKEALEYLRRRAAFVVNSPKLLMRQAGLLLESGEPLDGMASFRAALERGLTDKDQVLAWLQQLNTKQQYSLAVDSAEEWANRYPGVDARRWHAQTLVYAGRVDDGVAILQQISTEFPEDHRVTRDIGEAFNMSGQFDLAAQAVGPLVAQGKDDPRALMILGWSLMGRKLYKEAKATFEKAAAGLPNDESVLEAIREASAMLGQGDNSDIKSPIDPVAIPERILNMVEAHPPADNYGSDQQVIWLRRATGCHFDPKKPFRQTWTRRARILTAQGASSLSAIEHPFDSVSERIHINRVEVWDENGQRMEVKNVIDDAYVVDADESIGSYTKKLHFQIPGLRPGCVVEYEFTTESKDATKTFPFQRHLFTDCAADVVFVTGPELGEVAESSKRMENIEVIREENLRAWVGLDLPFLVLENDSMPVEDLVPALVLGGKEGSWEDIARTYLDDHMEKWRSDEDTAAQARELTKGARDDKEKIARLARFVQKEISYTAIEFGTRARSPNPAGATLSKRYGDCKDQALLLHQLLQAAGVESHLAVVSTNWRVWPELPSLDQFNHMVVHVPVLGEKWLVDPTDKGLQLEKWSADNLWHSHALILDREAPRLVKLDSEAKPGSALVESVRVVRLDGLNWRVSETITSHGYYGSWLRSAVAGLDASQQLQAIQTFMERQGHVRLHEVRFDNRDDFSEPARLLLEYEVPDAVRESRGGHQAALPAIWERRYVSASYVKDRYTDFCFRYPFQMRSKVTFEDVSPQFVESFEDLARETGGAHTHCRFHVDASMSNPVLDFEFDAQPGEHPAALYSEWQEEWNAARRSWEHTVEW